MISTSLQCSPFYTSKIIWFQFGINLHWTGFVPSTSNPVPIKSVSNRLELIHLAMRIQSRSKWIGDKAWAEPCDSDTIPYNVSHVTKKWPILISNKCYIIGRTKTFFMWFRIALVIRLNSYDPRHASDVLWYNIIMWVYCKPVYTSLLGMQLCLTTKLTYFMTSYYTSNDSFTASDASFHKNKVG